MSHHKHVKIERTPEEIARIRVLREQYQRERLTPEQMLEREGDDDFIPLSELLAIHELAFKLKKERLRQGVSLVELSQRTGIDQAAISRLENGRAKNPTIDTLNRIAHALGKAIHCTLVDAPPLVGSNS